MAQDGKKNQAAVASRTAARLYGLSVLAENIFFNASNYTRFFIIGPKMEIKPEADKITLVISVRHEPGALYHVLGYFFYGGMNMTHLNPAPWKEDPSNTSSTSTSWEGWRTPPTPRPSGD